MVQHCVTGAVASASVAAAGGAEAPPADTLCAVSDTYCLLTAEVLILATQALRSALRGTTH